MVLIQDGAMLVTRMVARTLDALFSSLPFGPLCSQPIICGGVVGGKGGNRLI